MFKIHENEINGKDLKLQFLENVDKEHILEGPIDQNVNFNSTFRQLFAN